MHQNLGMMTLNADLIMAGPERSRSLIVTGVGRSGTSMVAGILRAFGVPMGPSDGLAVGEDQEFRAALLAFDFGQVRALVDRRCAEHAVWGLKFPSLQNHLHPPQLSLFPGARLIVVMRDTVATAARALLSDPDQTAAATALVNVAKQIVDIMQFAMNAPVPVLLLSYEKCVAFPRETLANVVAFAGLSIDDAGMERALEAVQPNNPSYIRLFHSDHYGFIDGIAGGHLVGWARAWSNDDPVRVDILADGRLVHSCVADEYRGDLEHAGIAHGRFGFRIKLKPALLKGECTLQVFVVTRSEQIYGSKRTVRELTGARAPA